MIALVTPTGGRESQIRLCARLMKNQTHDGEVVWIIVDDCQPSTTDFIKDDFREGWTIIKRRPTPFWQPGYNTQARNISVGVNAVYENYREAEIDAIFIIEDDDYYRPIYLERMTARMNGYKVIGEVNTIYYNVFFRRHVANQNNLHASLFQVAFTFNAVPLFRQCYMDKFIDAKFFRLLGGSGVNLFFENHLAIGIKGIPGRAGIGAGHGRQMNMKLDIDMDYLKSLIGNEDAGLYSGYYGGNRLQ